MNRRTTRAEPAEALLAKLGPIPTQEASSIGWTAQCAPARGRGVVPKRAEPAQRNDAKRLPHPSARSPKGEHGFGGGRRRAASADGCHRRAVTLSEGAGAERKGFEPLVPLRVRLISNQVPSATRSSLRRGI